MTMLSKRCIALPSMLFIAIGCSTTPCDEALDHAQECGFEDLTLSDSGEECATFRACQAECIKGASCNEIRDALELQDNDLTDCIEECGN
jgi:hypothetical protein